MTALILFPKLRPIHNYLMCLFLFKYATKTFTTHTESQLIFKTQLQREKNQEKRIANNKGNGICSDKQFDLDKYEKRYRSKKVRRPFM